MLEKLEIKNVATFDNSGIEIPMLKKINFFYGANGSGKTTITKYIYEPNNEIFSDCQIKWKHDIELKALVYNKDFRERNFGKGSIDGIFTLGRASKEEIEIIEDKRKELDIIINEGIKVKLNLENQNQIKDKLETDFKESIWGSIYKKYEIDFKEAFKGAMKSKTSFCDKLLKEFNNNTSILKTIEELKEKAKIILGDIPQEISKISTIDFSKSSDIENDHIWKKKIIGKTDVEIAKLIQRLNINDWVNEGKEYLQEKDEICPFCQKDTITEDFRKQLESYFDESFITDTKKVKSLSDEYIRVFDNLINELQKIEETENANQNTKLNLNKFSSMLKTLNSQFIANKEFVNSKIKEPSRSIGLISTSEQFEEIASQISLANENIEKHNDIVSNYVTEKNELIDEIWKYIIEENRDNIKIFIKNKKGLETGIENISEKIKKLKNEYKELDQEIKELSKNVTGIEYSINEINKTLSTFGFQNFEIVPSKIGINQYQIQRENGELAEQTLSEGEITFITLLYFLQLAKGSTNESDINNERILVIDDPISSLDSNVLFVVSTLLKEVIKNIKANIGNIKQLILLTHNVYFHKEVSFINSRNQESSETNFWILRKNSNVSSLQDYKMNNPIQSSYELLWREYQNINNNSVITIQNIMRRILETYFKILGGYKDDDIIEKFDSFEEQQVCRSLLCWINDGSHCIPDSLEIEHQNESVEKYKKVFKEIFIKSLHEEHYKMMMKE